MRVAPRLARCSSCSPDGACTRTASHVEIVCGPRAVHERPTLRSGGRLVNQSVDKVGCHRYTVFNRLVEEPRWMWLWTISPACSRR